MRTLQKVSEITYKFMFVYKCIYVHLKVVSYFFLSSSTWQIKYVLMCIIAFATPFSPRLYETDFVYFPTSILKLP